ncbi:hypothetical protein C8R45DRAFT_1094631 [Mycena sanguinolenta]|nr:hypothetical protein C8R45DRAFT_1094631 [Mycena sanguinolenta]
MYIVYDNFAVTGDWMPTSLPDLEFFIDSGVRVTIFWLAPARVTATAVRITA